MTTPATTLDSKAVAEALNISAKELRVYLRAIGYEKTEGRYVFSKADVATFKKAYPKWIAERAASRKAKADAKVAADNADEPKAS
ncbi:hypothetical protein [Mycobacterium avium]|uniref:hypothetical protein n=1 Tax=Mycobacterium avium TaxID=1764 RepID=UPI0009FDD197|nr:hypothetical protein [Mycobacterium avium]